ncbi:metal-dependent hydrolase [Desulfonatronospira thiodismutans ASO3-1]|uniref:Metal-dependent hydrolase n=1 Tax=Desulfonatronospira thiodismutans ASO3-1 TaxID=555779 RepID=D6SSW9_9BACT|nr:MULTISPECIES: MBL fold metallo-hydrolase [Desulfonatronospira]EFI33785.1 metal-dependent hydrolase [Desulfonatronospira thiodismutans ASO3-1]RQD77193.1 MAG: MBL fold metallo-hydrolase [Desulfonatronospira sp. MSAO_Bac3]
MEIVFWGARGSIPVCGPEYVRYGGETTCVEVRNDQGGRIILDAGTGIRRLGAVLLKEQALKTDLFFTHTHWDHIMGLPFFQPLYQPGFSINLYGQPRLQGDIHRLVFKDLFRPPHFPVPYSRVMSQINYQEFQGGVEVQGFYLETIALSHPNLGQGFRISSSGRTFVFLTDNELGYCHRGGASFEEYVRFARDADLLVHDSEFTPEEYRQKTGWGHSTCMQAMELAAASRVKRLGLFHHNQDRNDDGVDQMVQDCAGEISGKGLALECFGVFQGQAVRL